MVVKEYHRSEDKFIEWSSSIDENTFDVKWITERVTKKSLSSQSILDVGGGMGAFALALSHTLVDASIDVIDHSSIAKEKFISADRIRLISDNFLVREFNKTKYDIIIFRTVLHHIIGSNEMETYQLQMAALNKAHSLLTNCGTVYVVENFFDPLIGEDTTGRIIYSLTKSKWLAAIIRKLGANTAGEGVRFRSYKKWNDMIESAGFINIGSMESPGGRLQALWQTVPLLCKKDYQKVIEIKPSSCDGTKIRQLIE